MAFLRRFAARIKHVHMKDVWWGRGDGTVGVFGGHVSFGDARRYWDFRSLGRGMVDFESIIAALNDIGYAGPLSRRVGGRRAWTGPRRHRGRGLHPQGGLQARRRRLRRRLRPLIPPTVASSERDFHANKLRFAMVGGGRGAFIGSVHRRAAEFHCSMELVAGALAADPERPGSPGRTWAWPRTGSMATGSRCSTTS